LPNKFDKYWTFGANICFLLLKQFFNSSNAKIFETRVKKHPNHLWAAMELPVCQ